MEIRVNIPKNDYVQPTEVREEVVQAICTTFLETHIYSVFHPFCDRHRCKTMYVATKNPRGGFNDSSWAETHKKEGYVRFNGGEMKAAFKALQNAGYYMFRTYKYGTWMGYECSKKPFMENGERVTEFNDFID